MADFNPDQYLAEKTAPKPQAAAAFDPDRYLTEKFQGEMNGGRPPAAPSIGDKAFKAVEDAGGAVLEHPLVKGPLAWAGDKLERYVDAPFRAEIGALQSGDNVYAAAGKAWDQFGQKPLPSTPTAEQMMAKTGLPTKKLSEYAPGMFSDTGEGIALKRGGVLDASPAGVAGALTQPSMWALPGEAIMSGSGKLIGAAGKGAATVGGKFSPLLEAANAAAGAAKKGVFNVGEALTSKNLKAAEAFKASESLTAGQLLRPGSYLERAGQKVGAARDVIADTKAVAQELQAAKASGEANGFFGGMTAKDAEKLVPAGLPVQGGQEALSRVRDIITQGEKDAFKHPGSQQLIDRIDRVLEAGGDVPLKEVDNLIQDLNKVGFTEVGNPRSLEPRWKGPLAEARGELDKLLNSIPEGQTLQAAKDEFRNLKVAEGRGSKLRSIMSLTGIAPAATAAALLHNPAIAAAALTSRVVAPRTYFQIVGAAKIPKSAVNALVESYQTGRGAAIRSTMTELAKQYPQEIARIAAQISNHAAGSPAMAEKDDAMKRRVRRLSE